MCQKKSKSTQKRPTKLRNIKKNQSRLKVENTRLAAENDILSQYVLRLRNEASSLRQDIYNMLQSREGEIKMAKK